MAALNDNKGAFLHVVLHWESKGPNTDKLHMCTPAHEHKCSTASSFIWKTHPNYAFNVKFMDTHIHLDRLSRRNTNLMLFGFEQWIAAISPYGGALD